MGGSDWDDRVPGVTVNGCQVSQMQEQLQAALRAVSDQHPNYESVFF